MNPSEQPYNQPENEQTRQRVIAHGVNSLSKERDSSPVVTAQEFERTIDYCLGPSSSPSGTTPSSRPSIFADACSPSLVNVLRNFRWFDHGKRIFCQDPLPHLITDLLTGLYGYPYHANTRKLSRIAYQAKDTVMFTDLFVFDQARYLYDLLPTLPFFQDAFSVPEQLILRVCMDAIRRHSHFGCTDLFQGSDLAARGEEGFNYWFPPSRESIGPNCPKIETEDPPPDKDDCPF